MCAAPCTFEAENPWRGLLYKLFARCKFPRLSPGIGFVSIGARSMAPEFGKPIHQLPLIRPTFSKNIGAAEGELTVGAKYGAGEAG